MDECGFAGSPQDASPGCNLESLLGSVDIVLLFLALDILSNLYGSVDTYS